jgi:archaellum biogenesis protein FlaJ (TadC family)
MKVLINTNKQLTMYIYVLIMEYMYNLEIVVLVEKCPEKTLRQGRELTTTKNTQIQMHVC